jgi:NTE family protein
MDITLALGSGGMRGVAHIGVLRVLEREGFHIRAVAGTSMGAIIAAFYAYGFPPDEIEHIVAAVDQSHLYGWPFSEGPGLLGVHKIAELLRSHLGDSTFDNLSLPCAAIAVDLKSNREIVLQEGRVVEAVLGSMSIPGLFPPREVGQYSLIDGGVLDPVPVRAARALAPGLPVVAVSLMSPLEQPATPLMPQLPDSNPIAGQIARLNITQAFSIFAEAVDIGQRQMAELRLKADAPEVLIHPGTDEINLLDRIDVAEVAGRGERAAELALPELRRAVAWPARIRRSLGLPTVP